MIGRPRADRRRFPDAGLALGLVAVLAALTYVGSLHYPAVFDSARWLGDENLRALRDLATSDRYVSKKATYWLHHAAGGRFEVLRAVHAGLHALTAFAAFVFFRRLNALVLGGTTIGPARFASGAALAVAAMFTVHPVNVYAVADPGQMELVLATLFGLAMLAAFLEGLVRPGPWWLLASVVLYTLAVLSKENLVPLPALALAMAALVQRPTWSLARRLAPACALLGLVALWIVVAELGQVHDDARRAGARVLAGADASSAGLHARSAVTQALHFFRYEALWVVPLPGWMSIDVQRTLADAWSPWAAVGPAAFAGYGLGAGWLLARGGRIGLVGFGLAWPWLLFLPELAAIRLEEGFVLYRSYPWMLGALAAVVTIAAPLLRRRAGAVAGMVCVVLALLAHERLTTLRSAHAVWDDAVRKNRAEERKSPAAYRAYLNRGHALLMSGRAEAALADFDAALALRPGLPYALSNRGIACAELQRYPEAFAAFDAALAAGSEMRPRSRARVHSNRAALSLRLGQSQDALADLRRAAALDPGRAEYRTNAEQLEAEIAARGR